MQWAAVDQTSQKHLGTATERMPILSPYVSFILENFWNNELARINKELLFCIIIISGWWIQKDTWPKFTQKPSIGVYETHYTLNLPVKRQYCESDVSIWYLHIFVILESFRHDAPTLLYSSIKMLILISVFHLYITISQISISFLHSRLLPMNISTKLWQLNRKFQAH